MNLKLVLLNAGLVFGLTALEGCGSRRNDDVKVSQERDVDRSHNYFTGSDTVTDTTESTYKNRNTGATSKKKVTNKVKYDEYGNKISESKEMENDAAR